MMSRPIGKTSPTVVYAWGRGDLGQLGLGDDMGRDCPTTISALSDDDIIYVAASDFHSAFLTGEGELYVTGSNESGQLGGRTRESQYSLVQIPALEIYRISHIACGQSHTIAVTDVGDLVSWGTGEFGQLGHKDTLGIVDAIQPRIIKGTRDLHFVRVSCGAAHSLALTGSGEVYSFGQGIFGALGTGSKESSDVPCHIEDLWGLGIIQIACGENHSAALSVDGQVFTWGRGKYGQLGHDSVNNEYRPLQVKSLADQTVEQLVCGGDHTMAINKEGSLFSWGRGHWGQTGLGTTKDVLVPTRVFGLDNSHVVQASAGARHSVAITKDWNVYGWGDGEQNQLGKVDSENDVHLLPIVLSFLQRTNLQILFAVAAGEHTITVFQHSECSNLTDSRSVELEMPKIIDEHLSVSSIKRDNGPLSDNEHILQAAGVMHVEFDIEKHADPELLKLPDEGSYLSDLHGSGLLPIKLPSLIKMLENGVESPRKLAIFAHAIEDTFSSVKFLTLSLKFQPSYWHSHEWHNSRSDLEVESPGLDVFMIRDLYHRILQLYNPMVVKKLGDSMIRLLLGIEKLGNVFPASRWSRALLIILQSPLIGEKGLGDMVSTKLFSVFSSISPLVKSIITQWLRTYPRDIFGGRFVRGVQKYITNRKDTLEVRSDIPREIVSAIKVLSILNEANSLENLIPYTEFYNHAVCDDKNMLRWEGEFIKFVRVKDERDSKNLVSFCQVPFMLSPKVKSQILQVEAFIHKKHSVEEAVIKQLFWHSFASPYLVLMVNRCSLIGDTLRQLSDLSACTSELRKPLKVKFEGEDGVDQGGVTKEFFQLLVRELFNVAYGMFVYNEDTRNFWFNRNSMESEHEFWLVGAILGLAIYNGVILDIHFPLVVYKKIMNLNPCLDDLKDFQPEVARSLQQLLDYEGDVADTFCLCFQVSYDYFGEMRTIDLITDGGNISVTNDNRHRYVDLYVKYLLTDSIESQFHAFSKAFHQVCGGEALKLFRYEELELLICGLPHFDFDALAKMTRYEGGYTKESQVIKWFWELVKEMSFDEKKSLLFFATGNDRAPIGGLGSLKFIIHQNGDDTDRLPTAHTCFNVLLLPEYASKSKLANRLKLAISNSTGFGLE